MPGSMPGAARLRGLHAGAETQAVIRTFGVDKYGQPLFVPVAGKRTRTSSRPASTMGLFGQAFSKRSVCCWRVIRGLADHLAVAPGLAGATPCLSWSASHSARCSRLRASRRALAVSLVNTGMGLPPVVVGRS